MAGNHPSYDKRGMSEQARRNKIKYDTKYHATPSRIAYRTKLSKANRDAGTHGNGDGLDMSHTKKGGLVKEARSKNRARNGSGGRSRLK